MAAKKLGTKAQVDGSYTRADGRVVLLLRWTDGSGPPSVVASIDVAQGALLKRGPDGYLSTNTVRNVANTISPNS